jgi:hypothetical protein
VYSPAYIVATAADDILIGTNLFGTKVLLINFRTGRVTVR